MFILELESLPLEQEPDLLAFERRMGDFVAGLPFPVRLIGTSRPFAMAAPIAAVDAQLLQDRHWYELAVVLLPAIRAIADLSAKAALGPAEQSSDNHNAATAVVSGGARSPAPLVATLSPALQHMLQTLCGSAIPDILTHPEDLTDEEWCAIGAVLEQLIWTTPYRKDMRALYEKLAADQVRSSRYALICFAPANVQAEAVCASLSYATGRQVVVTEELPTMLVDGAVDVEEYAARFVPTTPGGSYYSVLRSYALAGVIDASVLHPFLALPFDVTIAIDVRTMSATEAMRTAEWVYSAAKATLRDGQVVDTRSEQRLVDAQEVMHALPTESMHEIQIAILVRANDARELAANCATVRDRLGSTVRFEAVRGGQRELMKLFSTIPTAAIDAPWARSTKLSHGVGCLFGIVGYYRPSRTSGLLWGVDAYRSGPLFLDPFTSPGGGEADKSGHMLVLGQTGSGKTFFLNVMSIRAAVLLGYRVIWIEANENGERITRAAGAGGRRHHFDLNQTVNILELVYGPEDGVRWETLQVAHVKAQIGLMMGTVGIGTEGTNRMIPRPFTTIENGFLERALLTIYTNQERSSTPVRAGDRTQPPSPILDDLILALEWIAEEEAAALARELRIMVYGSSTATDSLTMMGRLFNGQTTVDWSMDADVVCFDLTDVQRDSSDMTTFFYVAAIGAFYRYMRDPLRDRRRKTLLVMDEFGLACQTEAVGQLAAVITKVARKYGIGMVVADQNPLTFLDSKVGQIIMENCRTKIMFKLDALPARRMAEALPELNELHLAQISQADVGRAVAVMQNNVCVMQVKASDHEKAMLMGS